jgi:hypothetical protein
MTKIAGSGWYGSADPDPLHIKTGLHLFQALKAVTGFFHIESTRIAH